MVEKAKDVFDKDQVKDDPAPITKFDELNMDFTGR
jgi:hypothetical protein